jgi:hypothetical protein
MARVHHVKKAQKDQGKCRCGHEIKKGEPYKWTQLYRSPKMKLCDSCSFKSSDLTGSEKQGRVLDALDAINDALGDWDGKKGDSFEDMKSEVEAMAEEIREVSGEYQESADAIHDSFSESETADQCEEWAQERESLADEIQQALDSADPEDDDKDWGENLKSEIEAAAGNCPF